METPSQGVAHIFSGRSSEHFQGSGTITASSPRSHRDPSLNAAPPSIVYYFNGSSQERSCRAPLCSAVYAQELKRIACMHYFIYRDLRDVVASEVHYLGRMNRCHALIPILRAAWRSRTHVDAREDYRGLCHREAMKEPDVIELLGHE